MVSMSSSAGTTITDGSGVEHPGVGFSSDVEHPGVGFASDVEHPGVGFASDNGWGPEAYSWKNGVSITQQFQLLMHSKNVDFFIHIYFTQQFQLQMHSKNVDFFIHFTLESFVSTSILWGTSSASDISTSWPGVSDTTGAFSLSAGARKTTSSSSVSLSGARSTPSYEML